MAACLRVILQDADASSRERKTGDTLRLGCLFVVVAYGVDFCAKRASRVVTQAMVRFATGAVTRGAPRQRRPSSLTTTLTHPRRSTAPTCRPVAVERSSGRTQVACTPPPLTRSPARSHCTGAARKPTQVAEAPVGSYRASRRRSPSSRDCSPTLAPLPFQLLPAPAFPLCAWKQTRNCRVAAGTSL